VTSSGIQKVSEAVASSASSGFMALGSPQS
jgi:hypothetical protein